MREATTDENTRRILREAHVTRSREIAAFWRAMRRTLHV